MESEVLLRQTNFRNNLDTLFQFQLARDLGMTVTDLRSKMPLKEYNQWISFYTYENNEKNKAIAMQEAEMKKRNG